MKSKLIIILILSAICSSIGAQIVPIEDDSTKVFSWTISDKLGTPKRVVFDSIPFNFQNQTLAEGSSASKASIASIGSPTYDRIFERREDNPDFLFLNVFSDFMPNPEKIQFINTKIPLSNVWYQTAGGLQTREERFKVLLSMNANKSFNFGGRLDYVYARGFYGHQRVRQLNYQFFTSYVSDRYQLHAVANPYDFQNFENGGITDDRYITNPKEIEGKNPVQSQDIPTFITNDVSNKNSGGVYFLSHRYNLGFYRELPPDTTKKAAPPVANPSAEGANAEAVEDSIREEFVPVSSIIHTMKFQTTERTFFGTGLPENYYPREPFLTPDSTQDRTSYSSFRNTFALSLREGFNKYAKAGLTAFINADIRSYKVMDTLSNMQSIGESVVSIGAELSKQQGKVLTYRAYGELGIIGKETGQVKVLGDINTRFKLGKDTVNVNIFGSFKNLLPNFYHRTYHSNWFWWDNDFSFEQRVRFGGELSAKKLMMGLKVSAENLTNYIYLDSIGPKQNSGSIQVLTASLYKNFAFRAFHWDNEITYQKSSNQAVLPLPDLTVYSNMYILTRIQKVLTLQMGVDCRYFTKYYAMNYQPALGQFYVQDKMEIGNYPLVNVYANLHLKYARFFVMLYNAGAGLLGTEYFTAPHYPMNPFVLKLGISVNFYN